MLLTTLVVTVACPKDTNLSAVEEVGYVDQDLPDGKKRRKPVYAGTYARGVQEGWPLVPAPLDLHVGDMVRVVAVDKAVYDVARKGKTIFEGESAKAEAARTAARAAKLAAEGR